MVRQKLLFSTWVIVIHDLFLITLAYFLAFFLRGIMPPSQPLFRSEWYLSHYLHVYPFYLIFTIFFLYFYQRAYPLSFPIDKIDIYKRTVKAVAEAVISLIIVFFFTYTFQQSRMFIVLYTFFATLFLLLKRHFLFKGKELKNPCRVLIVGDGEKVEEIRKKMEEQKFLGFEVVGILPMKEIKKLKEILVSEPVDWVLFAEVNDKNKKKIESAILLCEEMGITSSCFLEMNISPRIAKLSTELLFDTPVITFHTISERHFELFVKYFMDKIIAIILLILAAPVMILSAILIKLTSKGPVLFKQERCGLNGRKFILYKFRTMYVGAHKEWKKLWKYNEIRGPAFKIKNDPRITGIGRILRRYSIDELPQLFNVLKGDMSIVGPRPPLPEEVEMYELWHRRSLSMKPGLTCLWQISGRSDLSFDDRVILNLQYIDNWSLWLDIIILLKTIPAVFSGKGAY